MTSNQTNLSRSIRQLIRRAHTERPDRPHCYKEGGLTVMVNRLDRLDPTDPIRVNSAGEARVPPKPLIATLLLDNLMDQRLSYLSVGYAANRGQITRLKVPRDIPPDEEFWWLTVVTALNVEARSRTKSRRKGRAVR